MPATQTVAVGSEMMEIPCRQWLPRQTVAIQVWSMAELLVLLVFAIHAVEDVRERMQARRR